MRRALQRINGDALDEAIGTWPAARDPDRPQPGRAEAGRPPASLAVDGKTVRGARSTDATQVHLLAGHTSIAAALRHHARNPTRPLATLGIT